MHPACHDLRTRLRLASGEPTDADRAHAGGCEDCAAWLEARELGAVSALLALAPHPAPPGLDGLVVAALHAGHRQDRAVEEVRLLGRQRAPEALARRLAGEGLTGRRLRAPDELARRVDRDLRRRDPRPARPLLAAASALVLLLALPLLVQRPSTAPERGYSFTVREISPRDLDRLEPSIRGLVSGWTGGLSEVEPH